jgi:hypothetical protein
MKPIRLNTVIMKVYKMPHASKNNVLVELEVEMFAIASLIVDKFPLRRALRIPDPS